MQENTEQLTPQAEDRFEALRKALVQELGGELTPQQTILVDNLVSNERLKAKLVADIEQRGVVVKYYNGRQTLQRDNKSIAMLQKVEDQSRRVMMALGLIAREKPAAAADSDDGDDDFEDF